MKNVNFIFFIFLSTFIFSCSIDSNDVDHSQELEEIEESTVRKPYKLDKDTGTGWWHWTCKTGDPPQEGWSATKSGAKEDGAAACAGGIANVDIGSPYDDISYSDSSTDMMFVGATIKNIFGDPVFHPSENISENEFNYWLGAEEYQPIMDSKKAIIYLTIFGLYNEGNSIADIQANHNLNPQEFELLISRDFSNSSYVDIDLASGEYFWHF